MKSNKVGLEEKQKMMTLFKGGESKWYNSISLAFGPMYRATDTKHGTTSM